PRILPRITISRALMLAATWPLRPTVTRLPGRLMLPSTLPSIYSDSEPLISPLMNRPLPTVAWSPAAGAGLGRAGGSKVAGAGAAGRVGSGVGFTVGAPVWVGFHIALKVIPFLS